MLRPFAFLLAFQAPGDVPDPLVDSSLVHASGRLPPAVVAQRIDRPVVLNGVLDEEVWQMAIPATRFRRDVPSDGKPASERTEVRVAYDDRALYVGARMHTADPRTVSRRLDRRDSFGTFNDVFFVLIDSYHDHRTAFVFGVTPAGGRRDMVNAEDGTQADASWDPVWRAKTAIDSLGWTAEIEIPFSQLRFPPTPRQIWGIQFRRDILGAGEAVDWAWSSRAETGQASKYGHLLGLTDIPSPRRLEVLPYSVAQGTFTEGADPANPFDDGSDYRWSGGVDLKYGVTSDLTLDATINPDFGQVEADPAVVNLTAFETFFPERRPFFVEGANIFNFGLRMGRGFGLGGGGGGGGEGGGGGGFGASGFFYSRRIGRVPSRTVDSGAYVDQPAATTILGAAKLSGKTRSGWSIGALSAFTPPEFAQTADAQGLFGGEEAVEPFAHYGVFRAFRDLGGGRSGLGIMSTAVNRDIGHPALNFVRTAAYTGGVDFFHRFRRNEYSVTGWLGGSHIRGDPAAMIEAQRASARYFQRPDQDYATLDPGATTLTGFAGGLGFEKTSGSWIIRSAGYATSPGYELNDAGFQTSADRVGFGGGGGYRWVQPGITFRQLAVGADVRQEWNFGGNSLERRTALLAQGQLNNFWGFFVYAGINFRSLDDRETRGGPLIESPGAWNVNLSVNGDSRKPVVVGASSQVRRDRAGSWSVRGAPNLTLRSSTFSLRIAPRYSRSYDEAFYVAQGSDSVALPTFGQRYIFGQLSQTSLDISIRLDLALTPSMTLQLWAQPFVASGEYRNFAALRAPRTFTFDTYGTTGGSTVDFDADAGVYTVDADGTGPAEPIAFADPSFTVRSLRSNVVLRWEYGAGSTLFVVWTQNRAFASTDTSFRIFDQLGDLFGDNMQNVLLVKMNYWLDF